MSLMATSATSSRVAISVRSLVANLLADAKLRAVINFAAESHVDCSIHGLGEFIQTNIIGIFSLLGCVRGYLK